MARNSTLAWNSQARFATLFFVKTHSLNLGCLFSKMAKKISGTFFAIVILNPDKPCLVVNNLHGSLFQNVTVQASIDIHLSICTYFKHVQLVSLDWYASCQSIVQLLRLQILLEQEAKFWRRPKIYVASIRRLF